MQKDLVAAPDKPSGSKLQRRWHSCVRAQNKKYLCAIGSTSAGAQVSNSPSAVTS
jgi:hypothetical protein